MRYTINDMNKISESRGGKCLSPEYLGPKTHLEWECSQGHIWSARPTNIISGRWCHVCANKNSGKSKRKYSIEDMQEIAKKKGGECLSSSISTVNDRITWKCSNGHIWDSVAASVIHAGRWCKYCRYLSERKCRFVFEQLTGCQFPKTRMDMGGQRLELDGYCEDLKMAFEFNGRQHDVFMPEWHKTEQKFIESKNRDDKKLGYCEKNNISLTIICENEFKNDSELSKLIRRKTGLEGSIYWSSFYEDCSEIGELRSLAKARGGKLLSNEYNGVDVKLEWECSCGNIWKTKPEVIKRGSWCPICSGNVSHTIEGMRKLANQKDGVCLSLKYVNAHTKLKWKCSKGHEWMATPHNVKNVGTWCPKCGIEQGWEKRRNT